MIALIRHVQKHPRAYISVHRVVQREFRVEQLLELGVICEPGLYATEGAASDSPILGLLPRFPRAHLDQQPASLPFACHHHLPVILPIITVGPPKELNITLEANHHCLPNNVMPMLPMGCEAGPGPCPASWKHLEFLKVAKRPACQLPALPAHHH